MKNNDKEKVIIFIDMQKFEIKQDEIRVRDLLELAEEDPLETSLVLKHGNDLDKFDDLDEEVELENGMHFVVFHNSPTTVSWECGQNRLCNDLTKMGYEVKRITASDGNQFAVIHNFKVPLGRFAGQIIDLGILATPDFPQSIGSSIHVNANPPLFDYSDSQPNVRNVIKSALGSNWRYWSKRFEWSKEKSTRRLLSLIQGVFENA
ncbi:MAG: E2/UBC family protein [Candidatus Anammoxibacter sp.]